jgi:hypothetical protein
MIEEELERNGRDARVDLVTAGEYEMMLAM